MKRMRNLVSALLALCLLMTLTACGEEKGVVLVNDFDWGIAQVYISRAGAGGWGDPIAESMGSGDMTTLSLKNAFDAKELSVDYKVVDDDGDEYLIYNVYLEDGKDCRFRVEDGAFVVTVGETGRYVGEWIQAEPPAPATYYGVWWTQASENDYLLLYEDNTWSEVSTVSGVWMSGQYEAGDDGVELYNEDGLYQSLYTVDENGNPLGYGVLRHDNGYIELYGGFDSDLYAEILDALAALDSKGHFADNGYEINFAFGDDPVYMQDGAFILANDGMLYGSMPATVAMGVNSYNDTQDGYVEIEFTEVVLLDAEDRPDFVSEAPVYSTGANFGLYDCYTGLSFPASPVYGNSSRGDNAYYYEYESQGRTICVDWNFSTNWIHQPDGVSLAETQCFVRMPADYDGIVFGAIPAAYDFADYAERLSGGSEEMTTITAEEAIGALFCRVNAFE